MKHKVDIPSLMGVIFSKIENLDELPHEVDDTMIDKILDVAKDQSQIVYLFSEVNAI